LIDKSRAGPAGPGRALAQMSAELQRVVGQFKI
jgi:hypothetical protein